MVVLKKPKPNKHGNINLDEGTKIMKTYKDWNGSGKDLHEFLQIGDAVDDEIYDYFLGVLPPACNSSRCLQIGEPYTHDAGGPLFETLEKIDGQWVYTGYKHTPKTEKCLYV